MHTRHSEQTPSDEGDRTSDAGLGAALAEPPPQAVDAGAASEATVGSGRTGAAGGAAQQRGERRRGRHRARSQGHSRTVLLTLGAAMVAAGALGAVVTAAVSVPWLWADLGTAARHHPDSVLAAVLLAASLFAVWRMSGPRDP